MSTKADEQDAGATHGSERSAEHDGPAVAAVPEAQQALPSIIVDPALSELGADAAAAPSASESPATERTAPAPSDGANGAADAHADESAGAPTNGAGHADATDGRLESSIESNGGMRLSDEDADRFAANFRPSWEPTAPVDVPPQVAARTSLPALGPAVVVLPEPDLPEGAFSAADQRKRGLLMAGGAIAGFFVLAGLAFSMSNRALPAVPATATPKPQVAAPSAAPENASPQTTDVAPEAANAAAPADLRAAPPQPVPVEAPAEAAANDVATANAGSVAAEAPAAAPSAPAAAPQVAAAPPIAAAPAEPAAPVVEPAPPPAPKEVHVRIAATPASAHILIDGRAVSNPYDAHGPEGERHRVQVEATGHTARDITLGFERDQKLTIKLDRVRAPVAARPSAPARPPAAARAQAAARPSAPQPQVARSTMTITPRPAPAAPKPSAGKGAGFVNESPY